MRRAWSEVESVVLRWLYADRPARVVAWVLGRSSRSVYQQAHALGIGKVERSEITPGWLAELRRLHAAGYTDPEIADRLRCERHTVSHHRRAFGLPSNRASDRYARRVAEKTREQATAAGCRNLAEVRVLAWAARSAARGWPADLRKRHCDILEVLEARGPMTRREIADAIGMRWLGSRHSLRSNDPEGSYLAHLIARGMVVSLGRIGRVTGQGKGRSTQVYTLAMGTEREAMR